MKEKKVAEDESKGGDAPIMTIMLKSNEEMKV